MLVFHETINLADKYSRKSVFLITSCTHPMVIAVILVVVVLWIGNRCGFPGHPMGYTHRQANLPVAILAQGNGFVFVAQGSQDRASPVRQAQSFTSRELLGTLLSLGRFFGDEPPLSVGGCIRRSRSRDSPPPWLRQLVLCFGLDWLVQYLSFCFKL